MDKNAFQEEPEKQSLQQTKINKKKKRHLICLLLLASILIANAVYGLCTLEKGKPIWEAIATDNVIWNLWKKYPMNSRHPRKGLINGIMFSKDNPLALIDNELIHEGDVIKGVRVVQITPPKNPIREKRKGMDAGSSRKA